MACMKSVNMPNGQIHRDFAEGKLGKEAACTQLPAMPTYSPSGGCTQPIPHPTYVPPSGMNCKMDYCTNGGSLGCCDANNDRKYEECLYMNNGQIHRDFSEGKLTKESACSQLPAPTAYPSSLPDCERLPVRNSGHWAVSCYITLNDAGKPAYTADAEVYLSG